MKELILLYIVEIKLTALRIIEALLSEDCPTMYWL